MTPLILALQAMLALRAAPAAAPTPAPTAAPTVALNAAPAPGALRATGAELRTYAVEPSLSSLYVITRRTGILSFLGHEHAIVPTVWSAGLCLADPLPTGAHGTLRIETNSLVIDTDSARMLAGLGGGPGAEDRQEIQAKMLDPAHLDAATFREIRIDLEAKGPARGGRAPAGGSATIHGVTRPVRLAVLVAPEGADRLLLAGVLRVRQRDFGVEPESIAGVVKVADEVELHFTLTARATPAPCTPSGPG